MVCVLCGKKQKYSKIKVPKLFYYKIIAFQMGELYGKLIIVNRAVKADVGLGRKVHW